MLNSSKWGWGDVQVRALLRCAVYAVCVVLGGCSSNSWLSGKSTETKDDNAKSGAVYSPASGPSEPIAKAEPALAVLTSCLRSNQDPSSILGQSLGSREAENVQQVVQVLNGDPLRSAAYADLLVRKNGDNLERAEAALDHADIVDQACLNTLIAVLEKSRSTTAGLDPEIKQLVESKHQLNKHYAAARGYFDDQKRRVAERAGKPKTNDYGKDFDDGVVVPKEATKPKI